MGKRILALFSLICLLISEDALAQPNKNGVPIVTNYEHFITGGSEQNWCITQDHRGIIYVGNNNKGVLEYDGVEWRRIKIPRDPIIRSLVTGDNGVVYVGAVSEFGYLEPDRTGNMYYHSLSDTLDQEKFPFEDVMRTYFHQDKVYFCAFNFIFVYDVLKDALSIINTPDHSNYSFLLDGIIYTSTLGMGLMRYENGSYELVPGGNFFKEKTVTALVRYDETRLLASTYGHGLFLIDLYTQTIDKDFPDQELNDFFRSGIVTYIQTLPEGFAVSSINNGVVIMNREGEASEIISEEDGLLDNNATFVFYNQSLKTGSPLWITHFMGVSKLEPTNPFRVFKESAGFEDFVTDITYFNGTLYLSTFNGVYYRETTPMGTRFRPIEAIEGYTVRHLQVFKPSRYRSFLIASSENETYVIDPYKKVSVLQDLIQNKPDDMEDREEYAGLHVVLDPTDSEVFYTGLSQIVGIRYHRGEWKEVLRIGGLKDEYLSNKIIDTYGYLWTSSDNWVVRIDMQDKKNPIRKFLSEENGLPSNENNRVFLDPDSNEVLLGTRKGFYFYDYFNDTIMRHSLLNSILPEGDNLMMCFLKDHEGDLWYSFENEHSGWTEMVARESDEGLEVLFAKAFERLDNTSTDVFYSPDNEEVWFGKSNKLFHFNKNFSTNDSIPFRALIRRVTVGTDSVLFNGTHFETDQSGRLRSSQMQSKEAIPVLTHNLNDLGFTWAAPYFEQEDELLYSYQLEGFKEEWSDWKKSHFNLFTNLPHGSFTLHVKARNVYGNESLPASYSFSILRPWYAHFLAYLIYFLLAVLVVYAFIKIYTRRLKKENLRLEGVIQERTAEIRKQKEELTDSIEYASRIQRAMLPSKRLLEEHQIEHFILFRPRDIVSGDFYWIGWKNNRLLIVAADCTGHGVPGAFMSMLGMTFLDEIVIKSEVTNTDGILNQLREHVITSLKQSGQDNENTTKDGMDLAMISIDMQKLEFQYSGAYNPLYLVRKLKRSEKARLAREEELDLPRGSIHNEKHVLIQVRADQMPIGISEKTRSFQATTFKDEGYSIYMFSDGFLDQFGGPRGKKFMSRNFKKLILEIQSIPLKEQGAAMEKVLTGWMGEISQIDDILVMGLRLS